MTLEDQLKMSPDDLANQIPAQPSSDQTNSSNMTLEDQLAASPDELAGQIQQQHSQDSTNIPSDVTNAQSDLGNTDYTGLCEAWQEKMTGSPNMGTTAANAWDNYSQQGITNTDITKAKPGDKIYFSGDGGLGHTGIVTENKNGDLSFISATDNGVQTQNVNSWLQETGQQPLGFIPVQ